jgi:hypothetical protein
MKRSDFLKEMAGSLFHTVKSVYQPFLSEDLEKVEVAADRALGITWFPLVRENDGAPELEMKFIDGKPVLIARNGTNMQAMDGVCPVCSNIIIVTALYSSGKCLNCQKEYNFKTQTGDLQLDPYPVKTKGNTCFIGFSKYRKQGEKHA